MQRRELTRCANSDIMQRSEIRGYSITPSARANTFGFWETGKQLPLKMMIKDCLENVPCGAVCGCLYRWP